MTLAVIFDSVGFGEWFVLLAVVLVVVGPKNLPSTARKIGAYYSRFRRAAESFKRQLMDMDTEFDKFVNETASEAKEAFTVESDNENGFPGYENLDDSPENAEYNHDMGEYSSAEEGDVSQDALKKDDNGDKAS